MNSSDTDQSITEVHTKYRTIANAKKPKRSNMKTRNSNRQNPINWHDKNAKFVQREKSQKSVQAKK